jgi:hypothetical protein
MEKRSYHPSDGAREFATPSERDELERATTEIKKRLRDRGVELSGREASDELVNLLDAVERFEIAVQSKGGDLMVDEGPGGVTREPDDPHFVLPRRETPESVNEYIARIDEATAALRHHVPRDR